MTHEPPLPDPPAPPRGESLLVNAACLVQGFAGLSLVLNADNPFVRGVGVAGMFSFVLLMAAVVRLSNHTLALLGYAILLLERTKIIRAQYARRGKPDVTIH